MHGFEGQFQAFLAYLLPQIDKVSFLPGFNLSGSYGFFYQLGNARQTQGLQFLFQFFLFGTQRRVGRLVTEQHINLFLHFLQCGGVRQPQHQGDGFQLFVHCL